MILSVNVHPMQSVIIEDAVIYAFCRSSVIVYSFPFFRAPGHRSIKANVPIGLGVYGSPIGRFGARRIAAFAFAQDAGRTPFHCVLASVISPKDHPVAGIAYGGSVGVDINSFGNGFGPSCPLIQVDKGLDIPMLAKLVSRIVVICRIKTKVFNFDIRRMFPKLIKRDNPVYRIVAPGVRVPNEDGKVHGRRGIVDGNIV